MTLALDPSVPLRNPQREKFARNMLTMNGVDSFKDAFPELVGQITHDQLKSRASVLSKTVMARTNWLGQQVMLERNVTAERVVDELACIAFDRTGQKTRDRIESLDKLAKILGLYGKKEDSVRQFALIVEGGQPFQIVKTRQQLIDVDRIPRDDDPQAFCTEDDPDE